jgi:hypothetical protein
MAAVFMGSKGRRGEDMKWMIAGESDGKKQGF